MLLAYLHGNSFLQEDSKYATNTLQNVYLLTYTKNKISFLDVNSAVRAHLYFFSLQIKL